MNKRTFQITIGVELHDLPGKDRKHLAEEIGMTPEEIMSVADIDSVDFAELVADHLEGGDMEEMFAGSEMYCDIKFARAIKAKEIL